MKTYTEVVSDFLAEAWDRLPKVVKVAVYMFGATILDLIAVDLKPELLTFIPAIYRLSFFNLIEVLLVESAQYLKVQAENRKRG